MTTIQAQKEVSVEKLQGFKHSLKIEKETGLAKLRNPGGAKLFKTPCQIALAVFNHFSTNFIYTERSAIFAYYLIL